MSTQIKDGGGTGRLAQVDAAFRLLVSATSRELFAATSQDAKKGFWTSSGFVSLLAASGESGVYFHNNSGQVPHLLQQIHMSGLSNVKWRLIKNPTAGTLVSAGSTVVPQNLDSESPIALGGVFLSGSDGATVTDGAAWAHWATAVGDTVVNLGGAVVLNPGGTLALMADVVADADVAVNILWTTE